MKTRIPSLNRARCVACAVAFLLPFGGQLQATGYNYDYDYPEQGDDWYGRSDRPDPTRDYPAFEIDLFSAGDDYGYGYEPAVDTLGFGPPLALTQERHTEYHFRYFSLFGCVTEADCSDELFCNGSEACSATGCQPGVFPCDDSEPCTTDTCDDGLDECSNSWVPAPDEVSDLELALQLPGSPVATLSWDVVPESEWYSVYRGGQRDLDDLSCFDGHVAGTSVDDDGTFGSGGLYYYLASAVGCGLESSLGEDSQGAQRPDPPPCP